MHAAYSLIHEIEIFMGYEYMYTYVFSSIFILILKTWKTLIKNK